MRTSLVIDALQMAITHGRVQPGPCSTPTAAPNTHRLASLRSALANGSAPASAAPGCWDNAAAESFFAALKNEMYHRETFTTRARARFAVADYIEVFYNRGNGCTQPWLPHPTEALTDHQRRLAA